MADILDTGAEPGQASADPLADVVPPDMPEMARYIPTDVHEAVQRQDQADSWGQQQMGKVADIWGNLQQSKAAQMFEQALAEAKAVTSVQIPGTSAQAPDYETPVLGGTQRAQDWANTHVPGMAWLDQNAAGGNPIDPTSGTPDNQNLSVGQGLGLAALAAPGAGAVRGAVQDAQLAAKIGEFGIPAIAGAAEDGVPNVARAALTADHPLVQQVADVAGVDAQKVADTLADQSQMDRIMRTKNPDRDLKTPVQQAAYTAYKASSDADILNALGQTGEDIFARTPDASALPATPSTAEPSVTNLANAGRNPPPSPPTNLSFGDLWRTVNRGIVQAKMMNPLIHGWNLASETIGQYADPRMLMGIGSDFQKAEQVMRNPDALAQVMQEAPRLNLATMRQSANDLSQVVSKGLSDVPVVGGLKNLADTATTLNHRLLFETVGQRLQLASYYGARRLGMEPDVAAAYANAKFGQIPLEDQSTLMKWVGQNLAFAGRWTQGTGVQLGSLIGKPGFGGYGAGLSAAQKTQLANGLRGDFLKGLGTLFGAHALINHQLSDKWPWQNDDGRWLDINTGRQDAAGKTIYVTDPFFRRVRDGLHLLAIPGTPMSTAMGTTTTAALANKAIPLAGTAADLATSSKYLSPESAMPGVTGGPPIIAPGSDLTDALKQGAAFAVNQISPVQVNAQPVTRSPEGIKLQQPELQVGAGPESGSPTGAAAAVGPGAAVAAGLTGVGLASGPRDLGTKADFFKEEELKAYGDSAKPFQAAGIQLSTGPNTFSAGPAGKKTDIPTTAADKPIFQAAYKKVLDAGLKTNPNPSKAVLTGIERVAFTAGKSAVEKTLTTAEIQRRTGIAQGGSASAFWKGANSPAPSTAPTPSSSATAFWKKAS